MTTNPSTDAVRREAQTSIHSPHASDLRGAHGVVVTVETLGKGVAAILVAGVLVAAFMSGGGWQKAESTDSATKDRVDDLRNRFTENEVETRMLEYYVLELDGKLMSAGLIDYNESWAAQKKGRQAKQKETTK